MQLGSTELIKQAVAAGLGLAIVSRAAAADQLALGRIALVRVVDLTIVRTLLHLRLRGRATSAAASAFERMLDIPSHGAARERIPRARHRRAGASPMRG
jgi:DNA-binding transcriptional LysR family regulator